LVETALVPFSLKRSRAAARIRSLVFIGALRLE
jgi:hypothetical protein